MNNNDNVAVVVSNDNKNVTIYETINAIKNAGFKNVFIQWYNKDWNPSQEEQLEYIRKCGLNVIFAHLGYQGINNLWLDNEIGIVWLKDTKMILEYVKKTIYQWL